MGKFFVMLLLVAVMAIGGIIWFDYLGVIDAKDTPPISWIYGWFFKENARSQPATLPDEVINLDSERLSVLYEAHELKKMEIEIEKQEIDYRYNEILQIVEELEERQKALDDRENSLIGQAADAENKDRNVVQNALYLTGMPPNQAVEIISKMEDQDIIDVFRKTEELARAQDKMSLVSVWLSRMDPARASELQLKMTLRP